MGNFERTRNSTYGWIEAGEFCWFANVLISYGPLTLRLHDLDCHGWAASFSQKRNAHGPRHASVRLYHPHQRNSGFTIRLPAQEYEGWSQVLNALSSIKGGIQFHARQEIASGERVVIHEPVDRPILEALERHNAATLSELGDWRPEPVPEPDETNIVWLDRIIAQMEMEAA